jgi:internalin A
MRGAADSSTNQIVALSNSVKESKAERIAVAVREAERRIRYAASTGAKALDLSNLELAELPESLGELRQLQRLHISNTPLETFSDTLGRLTQLQNLNVSNNPLKRLPESLGHLKKLQSLYISNTLLEALPESLGQLAQLQNLNVSDNPLKVLPERLGQLKRLQSLHISKAPLKGLPESLGQLKQLRSLHISNVLLEALPDSLGELTKLQSLHISNIPLKALPESLGQLKDLRTIHISNTPLKTLPESMGQLEQLQTLDAPRNKLTVLPESLSQLTQLQNLSLPDNRLTELPESLRSLVSLKELYLHGNEALGIPPEILGPISQETAVKNISTASPAAILAYSFRTRRGRRPLNEAKLILVGRGGVGKTCLIKRLLHNTFDEQEHETPGIDIQPWEILLSNDDAVRLHVWDFGGQRILHGTHQFFLTERTLYLLVLTGREDNATQDAEYWLQLIRSFGSDSKVIIALNKYHQHTFDVNRGLLLEKYPFIVDFVKTDCKEPVLGVEELRRLIYAQTDALEHRKAAFPSDWFTIKERLAAMEENFVTWDQYKEICRELGETDPEAQRDLAKFLHILGIALHYADDPRLHDTRVLKPTWVTEGIYTLLRATQRENRGGLLYPADLTRALDKRYYPATKHDFLLRLMERFQLCFRLPENQERYLVPELLDENQPDIKELLDTVGLGFRYQYEVLPEGVLPRFIVQTHALSEAHPQWRWRTGVVLERDGCRAIVRADARERRVDIHIIGSESMRRALLAIIREKFDEQHRNLKGLTVDERVPVRGEPGVTVSYRHLILMEKDGEQWYRPEGMRRNVDVVLLLNGVESKASRAGEQTSKGQESAGPEPLRPSKCSILFFAANPAGTSRLALDNESREIDQKILGSAYRDALQFITKWAVQPDDLLQNLNQYRPHVVHFSGHGSPTEEIILLDALGQPKPVSKSALRHLFGTLKDNIRVVVLNACYSRPQAETITEVIDCAVGMKRAIGDKAAIAFAASFYRAIGFRRSVQEAFDQGKSALMMHEISEEDTPELVVRKGVDAKDVFLV